MELLFSCFPVFLFSPLPFFLLSFLSFCFAGRTASRQELVFTSLGGGVRGPGGGTLI